MRCVRQRARADNLTIFIVENILTSALNAYVLLLKTSLVIIFVRVVCESTRSLIFSLNNAILNWAKLRKRSNVPKGPLAKNNFPLTQLPFVCSTWRFITADASSAKHEWRSGSQIRKNTTPLVCKGLIALEMNKRPEKIIRQTKVGHGMVQP